MVSKVAKFTINMATLKLDMFYLGQEALGRVISLFLGQSFKDWDRFCLWISDSNENGFESKILVHGFEGQIVDTQ